MAGRLATRLSPGRATRPHTPDEAARLEALHACAVLDTLPEAQYDGIARLAAAICGTPIALVSLVDCSRQWFKARVGLEATETPRGVSLCDYALQAPGLFLVPDATADARFAANLLVTGDAHVRFYAGVALTDADGFALGTLCVLDRVPRDLGPVQRTRSRPSPAKSASCSTPDGRWRDWNAPRPGRSPSGSGSGPSWTTAPPSRS